MTGLATQPSRKPPPIISRGSAAAPPGAPCTGLRLAELVAGTEVAQALQLGIEYDPDPPHDAGSPAKAPPAIVELIGLALDAEEGRAAELHPLGQRSAG